MMMEIITYEFLRCGAFREVGHVAGAANELESVCEERTTVAGGSAFLKNG